MEHGEGRSLQPRVAFPEFSEVWMLLLIFRLKLFLPKVTRNESGQTETLVRGKGDAATNYTRTAGINTSYSCQAPPI